MIDDLVGGDPFGLGVEGRDDAVSEDGFGDVPDVGETGVEPPAEDGAGLGGRGSGLPGAGRLA